MVPETTNGQDADDSDHNSTEDGSTSTSSELAPERYPQQDLFICDVHDAVLKDMMQHMEHPFYSLTKRPETQVRRYEQNGNWIEITPGIKGLATIYDKDILIYAISQIMAKRNDNAQNGANHKITQRVRINAHEYLMFTNRGTSGRDYQALCDSLDRLGGTRISTNIKSGDEEQFDTFGLVDSASVRRKRGLDGRLLWVEVKLSDWVFRAINADEVLTLNREYFRLRRPIERRVYEIVRKHCGQKPEFTIRLDTLLHKSGAKSTLRKFRLLIRKLVESNHLPDYTVFFDSESDHVIFRNRSKWWVDNSTPLPDPKIRDLDTYEKAKKYLILGQSVYEVEQDWIQYWKDQGCVPLKNPDAAFLGFIKQRYVKHKQRG